MAMLLARVVVGAFGLLLVLGGVVLMAVARPGGDLMAALFLIVPGAVMIVAVVLERVRYRSLHAERTGDGAGPGGGEPRAPEPRFLPTGERFLDPTTHVALRVWLDPATGERRYVPEG